MLAYRVAVEPRHKPLVFRHGVPDSFSSLRSYRRLPDLDITLKHDLAAVLYLHVLDSARRVHNAQSDGGQHIDVITRLGNLIIDGDCPDRQAPYHGMGNLWAND